jgi:hypothetical protein
MSIEITQDYVNQRIREADNRAAQKKFASAVRVIDGLLEREVEIRALDPSLLAALVERRQRFLNQGIAYAREQLKQFDARLAVEFRFEPSNRLTNKWDTDDFAEEWRKEANEAFKAEYQELQNMLEVCKDAIPNVTEDFEYIQSRNALDKRLADYQRAWLHQGAVYQAKTALRAYEQDEQNGAVLSTLVSRYNNVEKRLEAHISTHGSTPELQGLLGRAKALRMDKGRRGNIYTSALQQEEYALALTDLSHYKDDEEVDRSDDKGNYLGKVKAADARKELEEKARVWAKTKSREYIQAAERALANQNPREALKHLREERVKVDPFLDEDTKGDFKTWTEKALAMERQLVKAELIAVRSREALEKNNFNEAWQAYLEAEKTFANLLDLPILRESIVRRCLESIEVLETEAQQAFDNSRPRNIQKFNENLRMAKNRFGSIDDFAIQNRLSVFQASRDAASKHHERMTAALRELGDARRAFDRGDVSKAADLLDKLAVLDANVRDDLGEELVTLQSEVSAAQDIEEFSRELRDLLLDGSQHIEQMKQKLAAARKIPDSQNRLSGVIEQLDGHIKFLDAESLCAVGKIEEASTPLKEVAATPGHPDADAAKSRLGELEAAKKLDDNIKTSLSEARQKVGERDVNFAELFRTVAGLQPSSTANITKKQSVLELIRERWLAAIENSLADAKRASDKSPAAPEFDLKTVEGHLDDLRSADRLNSPTEYVKWWERLGARVEAARARQLADQKDYVKAVEAWKRALDIEPSAPFQRGLLDARIALLEHSVQSVGLGFDSSSPSTPAKLSDLIRDLREISEEQPSEPRLRLWLAQASLWGAFYASELDRTKVDPSDTNASDSTKASSHFIVDLRTRLFESAYNLLADSTIDRLNDEGRQQATKLSQQAKIGIDIANDMREAEQSLSVRKTIEDVYRAVNLWKTKIQPHAVTFPHLNRWWSGLVRQTRTSLQNQITNRTEVRPEHFLEWGMLAVLADDLNQPPADRSSETRTLVNGLAQLADDFREIHQTLETHHRTGEKYRVGEEYLEWVKKQIAEVDAALRKFIAADQLTQHFGAELEAYRDEFKRLSSSTKQMKTELMALLETLQIIAAHLTPNTLDFEDVENRLKSLEETWRDPSSSITHCAVRQARGRLNQLKSETDKQQAIHSRVLMLLETSSYMTLQRELNSEDTSKIVRNSGQKYKDPTTGGEIPDFAALKSIVDERAQEHRLLKALLRKVGADASLKQFDSPLVKSCSDFSDPAPSDSHAQPRVDDVEGGISRRLVPLDDPKKTIKDAMDKGDFDEARRRIDETLKGPYPDQLYYAIEEVMDFLDHPLPEMKSLGLEVKPQSARDDEYDALEVKMKSTVSRAILGWLKTDYYAVVSAQRSELENLRKQCDEHETGLERAWADWVEINRQIARVYQELGGWNARISNQTRDPLRNLRSAAQNIIERAHNFAPQSPAITEMENFPVYKRVSEV